MCCSAVGGQQGTESPPQSLIAGYSCLAVPHYTHWVGAKTPYTTLGLADAPKDIKLCPFPKGFGQPLAHKALFRMLSDALQFAVQYCDLGAAVGAAVAGKSMNIVETYSPSSLLITPHFNGNFWTAFLPG